MVRGGAERREEEGRVRRREMARLRLDDWMTGC